MSDSHRYAWMKGFVEIIRSPHELGMKGNPEPLKTLVLAGILETSATLFIGWLHRTSPILIAENIAMMQPWMKKAGKTAVHSIGEFNFNQAFVSTLSSSFASIFAFGAVLWIVHWMLTKQSRKLYEIAGMGAYASGVYALGTMITGLMQYLFGSLQWAPHLGIFMNPVEQPFLFAVLSRMNIVWILSYALAAYAIVGMSFVEKRYGQYAAAFITLIVVSWYGLFSAMGAYFSGK